MNPRFEAELDRLVQVTGVRGQEALSKFKPETSWLNRNGGITPVDKLVCLRGVEDEMQAEAKAKQSAPVATVPKPQPATKPVAPVATAPKIELHGRDRMSAAWNQIYSKKH